MKKIISLFLLLSLVMVLGACGEKEATGEKNGNVGVLADMTLDIDETARKHMEEEHDYDIQHDNGKTVRYDNLSALLLALRANDIGYIGVNTETAAFILSQNDDLIAFDPAEGSQQTAFSMMTMEDNRNVYNILNDAIIELKEDGTLDKIVEEYLIANREKAPEPAALPVIDGADTIVVAVTGDMPPLDYISDDGKAAGFNVALLSAIAERTGVNIELSNIESGARMMALSSGKVDAIFWSCATVCAEHEYMLAREVFEGTLITEPYVSLDGMVITMK
ncbi:MAG: transporter substrate-binding domain-containing protein [Bacillota bacterium]|nr:transporter substrate-binding domain-containing protein [Bacillota bacterium]